MVRRNRSSLLACSLVVALSATGAVTDWAVADPGPDVAVALAAPANPDSEPVLEVSRNFHAFKTLVEAAELEELFQSDLELTFLIPNNEAFATRAASKLRFGDLDAMRSFVLGHVVRGTLSASELADRRYVNTLDRRRVVTIDRKNGQLVLNGQSVLIQEDITLDNAVVHVVSQVLM